MLKQRILAALVLLPLLLLAVFMLPSIGWQILLAVILLQGAWEWSAIMQLQTPPQRLAYVGLIGLLILGCAVFVGPDISSPILLAAVVFWLAATVWVAVYPAGLPADRRLPLRAGAVGVAIIVPLWIAGSGLQIAGTVTGSYTGWWLVIMLMLIFAADTGAYALGRLFGKTKLAPRVSPGKTWEGVAGALLGAALVVAFVWALVPLQVVRSNPLGFLLIALLTVSFSIVGDLTESMFKRHSKLKDSGTIIPGHGGLMDRIDSITAAAPVFAYGLSRLLV